MLLEYITLASSINFLFLAIVLLLKKTPNKKSNKILIVLFMFMAVYCSLVSFHYTALEQKNYSTLVYYSPIDGMFLLLMGPCLYFYILSVLNKPTPVFKWKNLLHLIPFIPYLSFCIYFLTIPLKQRTDWLIRDFHTGTSEMNWLNGIIYSQTITYLLLCYGHISKQLKTTNIIEYEKKMFNISWLKTYLIVNLCFIIITLPLCFAIANERTSIIIGQLAMDFQFIYMFFKWSLHSDTYLEKKCTEPLNKTNVVKLNTDTIHKQLLKLQNYMNDFKPFQNEACSIQSLSEQTGIPVYQLSNIINNELKKTFPEYINEYRINTAKNILLSHKSETITIESIATDCGFGSKSSFNRAFKKYSNNLTPSEFILQHKSSK